MEENIPDIMLNLGLTEDELKLYSAIKTHSDENGLCNKSKKELAKLSHISRSIIPKLKKALAMPRDELNGESLITIEKRVYEDGTILTDNIYITNLDEKHLELKKEKD